jgi:hypothetical protein
VVARGWKEEGKKISLLKGMGFLFVVMKMFYN